MAFEGDDRHFAGVLGEQQTVLADGAHAVGSVDRAGEFEVGYALRFSVGTKVQAKELVGGDAVDEERVLFTEGEAVGSGKEGIFGGGVQALRPGLSMSTLP